MWQWCAIHARAERAQMAEGEGETGDMADDRDGLARMSAGNLLKSRRHASDDLMPPLAVCSASPKGLLTHPGTEHVGGTGRLDQLRHDRDGEPRRGRRECYGLTGLQGGAGVDPGDRLCRELLGGRDGLEAALRRQRHGRFGCRAGRANSNGARSPGRASDGDRGAHPHASAAADPDRRAGAKAGAPRGSRQDSARSNRHRRCEPAGTSPNRDCRADAFSNSQPDTNADSQAFAHFGARAIGGHHRIQLPPDSR